MLFVCILINNLTNLYRVTESIDNENNKNKFFDFRKLFILKNTFAERDV